MVGSGPNAGDEIRLVDPDGGADRLLWRAPGADPQAVNAIGSLAWNVQATRLAFSSTHESWCSLFGSDVFTLASDGSQYRRLTESPACGALPDFPHGSVSVPVKNTSLDAFSGFMYFQGAASIKPVNLPPNGSATVIFEEVADLGDGAGGLQLATLIAGANRRVLFSTLVDVRAGGSVTTSEASIWAPDIRWQALDPTWHHAGEAVTYRINGSDLLQLPLDPQPLSYGTGVLAENAALPDFIDHLARGPTAGRASQVLYVGTYIFDDPGIFLVEEGSSGLGERLVTFDALETVQGLAWLPDGAGFLFSLSEGELFTGERASNLFLYDFTGPRVRRLTEYAGRFVGRLSASGSGAAVVYELGESLDELTGEVVDPDLYVLEIGSEEPSAKLLLEDARAPAWSW